MSRAAKAKPPHHNRPDKTHGELTALIDELNTLREDMARLESAFFAEPRDIHPDHVASARNLVHYLALRRHDIRDLQKKLARFGLSSLGRAESHALAAIDTLLTVLRRLLDPTSPLDFDEHQPGGPAFGELLLHTHTDTLLGTPPKSRKVRIMVTLPGDAADDYSMVLGWLKNGMDCARINCAHDDAATWKRMISKIRKAVRESGKQCPILMDLAGPKLRTGAIEAGSQCVKWHPPHDSLGRVTSPARIGLIPSDSKAVPGQFTWADAILPVPQEWLERLQEGDTVEFTDARGKKRRLNIIKGGADFCCAECEKSAYVQTGTTLTLRRLTEKGHKSYLSSKCIVGELPHTDAYITLKKDDPLILTKSATPGRPAQHDDKDRLIKPATIPCTLPEVFSDVRSGERIWFDDGKIGGVIKSVTTEQIEVTIAHARENGDKLRAGKGINLPDSKLKLAALSTADIEALQFVAKHADLVGLSFTQQASDVIDLQEWLHKLDAPQMGIILKIETSRGFQQLPEILLAAMRTNSAGIMIARGDLAVEYGYERLAEVQEEMLWLCEAAHIPVIWATQVLENLAKTGLPSRAEITDAAQGVQAECVMLNKGSHILEAIRTLDDILTRMQAHQDKKITLLRKLHWWSQTGKEQGQ